MSTITEQIYKTIGQQANMVSLLDIFSLNNQHNRPFVKVKTTPTSKIKGVGGGYYH